jgi:hypothetical protein
MRVSWLFLLTPAVLLVMAAGAFAQAPVPGLSDRPEQEPAQPADGRPYRGVFGGGLDDLDQSLTVTGSIGGGWTSDYLARFATELDRDSRPRGGGLVGTGSGSLSYLLGRPRASVSATVGTSAFYYEGSDQIVQSHHASASQGLQISENTRFSAAESVSYRPFRISPLLAGDAFSFGAPPGPPSDSFASADEYVSAGASLGLSHQLSRNVAINAGYLYQTSEWSESRRQVVQGARVGSTFGLARGLGLRVGYGYYEARFGDANARTGRNHSIDAGIDYAGALSLSRRTTLSFSTGSSAFRDRHRTHFVVIGSAQLNRDLGRSWRASLGYARQGYYADRLNEIVFSDSANLSVGGLLTRRLSVSTGIGASFGRVGFSGGNNGARSTYAYAGLSTALGRYAALGGNYSYYVHRFGGDVSLPVEISREIDRHSIGVHVTVWAPLFARVRSQNASR